MAQKNRFLFYDDSPVYGGHEVMALGFLEYVLQGGQAEVGFMYSPQNGRLAEELQRLRALYPALVLLHSHYTSGRFQFLRTFWAWGALYRTRQVMLRFQPQCVVGIQGEISLSSLGILASRSAGISAVSYLPMAHTRQQRGEGAAQWKDAILRCYYRLPHRYIVISASVAAMLRQRGVWRPIDVVENGVCLSHLRKLDQAEARAELQLPQGEFIAGLCGRVEFLQKGQDILLQMLESRQAEFQEWKFLILGDGPDREKLERLIQEKSLGDRILLRGWQRDMSVAYSAIDMLLLPSRFEGVPITMIEAMYSGLPIVATAADAMKELLPMEWLFPMGEEQAFADCLLRMRRRETQPQLEQHRNLVKVRFDKEQQGEKFAAVLHGCLS